MHAKPGLVRDCVVLGLAVGVFGLAFGVLAGSAGLSVAQACVMSLLVFTGASQFAAVSVVAAGGSVAAALGSALLLAARNGVYGVTLASTLGERGWRRLVAAQLVIDESTAMAVAQPERSHGRTAFWVTGASVFVFWNLGTLVGVVTGQAIGDPASLGLDAAFPAGFVSLLWPAMRHQRVRAAAALGAAIAVVAIPLARPGLPILLAAAAAIVVAAKERRP